MPIVKGFRRFQSNNASSRRVVTQISNLVPGSNVQQSGRSSAATFTSKRPIRKKLPSADRRAMLESFVNKYRAMNMGKFPSITSAQKEVGGGYYLIRKMLQEMEYNFKMSSGEKALVKENKKQTQGKDTRSKEMAIGSSGTQEVSSSQITMDQQLCEDALPESVSDFDKTVELKEALQPSISSANIGNNNITRDITDNIAKNHHVTSCQCHEKPVHDAKDESALADNFDFQDSESKGEQQVYGIRNVTRDMPERRNADELREKPSLWGNLKSLATGFINMWKK